MCKRLTVLLVLAAAVWAGQPGQTSPAATVKLATGNATALGATDAVTVPQTMSYQGLLADAGGNPLTGTYDMVFRLYEVAMGGTPVWEESQADVKVTDGQFDVRMGSVSPITTFPTGKDCYVEVAVEDEVILPRQQLSSVGYALNAGDVNNAEMFAHKPVSEFITTSTLAYGDIDGKYPNPTVAKLQGNPVAATAPSIGDVLKWDGEKWLPSPDNTDGVALAAIKALYEAVQQLRDSNADQRKAIEVLEARLAALEQE